MTLKQRKLKIELKNNPSSLWKAAMKAGYSPKSRTIYQNRITTHKIIDEVLGEDEKIKNDFEIAKELSLKNKDLTNYNRANEDLARIKGMFKDKSEVTTTNPEKIIIQYVDKTATKNGLNKELIPSENNISSL